MTATVNQLGMMPRKERSDYRADERFAVKAEPEVSLEDELLGFEPATNAAPGAPTISTLDAGASLGAYFYYMTFITKLAQAFLRS
ncbi:hypothetical protein BGZ72_001937 [Mortierella alpina]|nr:hypothetical protein BGZ72_001937 [Mortierella alpina]